MRIKKAVGKLILKLMGWTFHPSIPEGLKKYVLIAAPHTSNIDFFLAIGCLWAGEIKGHYLIKKEHFWWPLSIIIKFTGGIPVDRDKVTGDFIEGLKAMMQNADEITLLFTPEGTRSYAKRWKTGFYRVALSCGYPVVTAYADYARKEVVMSDLFYPTGDLHADLQKLERFYGGVTARHPEKFNPRFYKRKTE